MLWNPRQALWKWFIRYKTSTLGIWGRWGFVRIISDQQKGISGVVRHQGKYPERTKETFQWRQKRTALQLVLLSVLEHYKQSYRAEIPSPTINTSLMAWKLFNASYWISRNLVWGSWYKAISLDLKAKDNLTVNARNHGEVCTLNVHQRRNPTPPTLLSNLESSGCVGWLHPEEPSQLFLQVFRGQANQEDKRLVWP